MKKGFILILVFGLLIFSACGGGGGNDSSVQNQSPFEGKWAGIWIDLANHQAGTLTLTVTSDGAGSGIIYNTTLALSGSASGVIDNGGGANFTYVYPTTTYTAICTLTINNNGHLTGDCSEYSGTALIGTAAIDLTKM